MAIRLNMKKALTCLSIVAILMFCVPNVAVALTSNYSTCNYLTPFCTKTRHTGDCSPMARGSSSHGISNWNYLTERILTSSAAPNGIVYVGSADNNVYALDAKTGAKVWNYMAGNGVNSSPTVAYAIG